METNINQSGLTTLNGELESLKNKMDVAFQHMTSKMHALPLEHDELRPAIEAIKEEIISRHSETHALFNELISKVTAADEDITGHIGQAAKELNQ